MNDPKSIQIDQYRDIPTGKEFKSAAQLAVELQITTEQVKKIMRENGFIPTPNGQYSPQQIRIFERHLQVLES